MCFTSSIWLIVGPAAGPQVLFVLVRFAALRNGLALTVLLRPVPIAFSEPAFRLEASPVERFLCWCASGCAVHVLGPSPD